MGTKVVLVVVERMATLRPFLRHDRTTRTPTRTRTVNTRLHRLRPRLLTTARLLQVDRT